MPSKDSLQSKYSQYNRNLGVEYNLASANNVFTGKALLLKSFTEGKSGDDIAQASNFQYSSRKWLAYAQYEYVGKNYTAEVGYVPRTDFIKTVNPQLARYFFPEEWNYFNAWAAISDELFFRYKDASDRS